MEELSGSKKRIAIIILLAVILGTIGLVWRSVQGIWNHPATVNKLAGSLSQICTEGANSRDYEKRVALLTKCIEDEDFVPNQESSLYFFKRGFGYESLKKYDQALADYQRAIELKPSYATAYYNSGNIYLGQKKYEDALTAYGKAIEINPKDYLFFFNRGFTYRQMKKYEEAIKDYTQSLNLNIKYPNSYLERGYCYNRLKKHFLALGDYNNAIHYNPKYDRAYNDRGYLYFRAGKYDLALADYNKAIEINPSNSDPLENRGFLYNKTGRHKLALNDYLAARELKPNNARCVYSIGYTHWKLGHIDEAVKCYKEAMKMDPGFGWPYYNLAIIYYSSNDPQYFHPEEAIELLLKAMEIDGADILAYNESLAAVYAKVGDFQKALQYQQVAVDKARGMKWEKIAKKDQQRLDAYKEGKLPPLDMEE